jgi:hypothetical protein
MFPLYPFIETEVDRGSKEMFKNSESFVTQKIFSSIKALTSVLAKAVILTLYLLYNNIQ